MVKPVYKYLLIPLFLVINVVISLLYYSPEIKNFLNKNENSIDVEVSEDDVLKPLEVISQTTIEEPEVLGTTNGYVKIPVLMYHRIEAMPKSGSATYKGLFVTPGMFDTQMKYLKDNHYTTITPTQFYQYLKAGKAPNKVVLLTFDDGTKGQYTNAYRTLKKYGLTGTFYVTLLKTQISNAQILEMTKNGMVVDSHTMLHEDLRALNDKKQIKYEVDTSKKRLEALTSKTVASIAYPGCVADGDVFNQVNTSGYLVGFSCGKSIYHLYKNRYYLSRVHVFSNMTSFKRALTIGL